MGVGVSGYRPKGDKGPSVGNPNYVYSDSKKKYASSYVPPRNINPEPNNWKIVKAVESNGCTILKINYPNCTNYEGNKILVYKAALIDIINQKSIDPHFMDDPKYLSPIARFVPTDEGWSMALFLTEIFLED